MFEGKKYLKLLSVPLNAHDFNLESNFNASTDIPVTLAISLEVHRIIRV